MLRSILIIFRQLLNTNKAYIDVDGLFKTLIFVHKMSADIIKSVYNSAELVLKMYRLQFYKFVQWFISGGRPV